MTAKKNQENSKTYTLKVPRPQYDRLCETFRIKDTYFKDFNFEDDTITFKINETQRLSFIRHYYISEMFLSKNIGSYTV